MSDKLTISENNFLKTVIDLGKLYGWRIALSGQAQLSRADVSANCVTANMSKTEIASGIIAPLGYGENMVDRKLGFTDSSIADTTAPVVTSNNKFNIVLGNCPKSPSPIFVNFVHNANETRVGFSQLTLPLILKLVASVSISFYYCSLFFRIFAAPFSAMFSAIVRVRTTPRFVLRQFSVSFKPIILSISYPFLLSALYIVLEEVRLALFLVFNRHKYILA